MPSPKIDKELSYANLILAKARALHGAPARSLRDSPRGSCVIVSRKEFYELLAVIDRADEMS